jgi:hypothetical protein
MDERSYGRLSHSRPMPMTPHHMARSLQNTR